MKNRKITLEMILVGIIILILFSTYFIIAIHIPKDLEIKDKQKTCVVKGLEKSKEYDFTFKIDAQSEKDYNTFEIEVVEVTRYLHDTILKRIQFSSFSGQKTIHIETSDIHSHIEIRIKNKLQEKLTISNFWINNEQYVLEYRYIKDGLVRLIKDFNFKYPSVWQRGDFIKDGIKIVKQNWLVGAGGNAWRNLYQQNQEYAYQAKEAHSYPLEIWMSFGVLGIISYVGIAISIIWQAIHIEKENNTYKAIIIGLIFMFVHSIIDFDFSYFIMLILLFLMIASIHEKDKSFENKLKSLNILEYVVIVLIILTSFENLKMVYTRYFIKDNTYETQTQISETDSKYLYSRIKWLLLNNGKTQEIINQTQRYIEQEPYSNQNEMYEILLNAIQSDIDQSNAEQRIQEIEELEQVLKMRKRSSIYDISQIRQKANIMVQFSRNINTKAEQLKNQKLQEISKRFSQRVIDEYEEGREIIKQYQKTGEYKFVTEMQLESYKLIYEEAIRNIDSK